MISEIFEQFRNIPELPVCDLILLVEPVSIAGSVRYFDLVFLTIENKYLFPFRDTRHNIHMETSYILYVCAPGCQMHFIAVGLVLFETFVDVSYVFLRLFAWTFAHMNQDVGVIFTAFDWLNDCA